LKPGIFGAPGNTVGETQAVRRLRVFLCHSSGDKPAVRELYRRLCDDGVEPWLDEENLLPGQDWALEIPKAVRASDVVIICLSRAAVTKAGYVQKEIKVALDIADEQPEGAIFLIPLKLEECDVPARLQRLHWVNYYEKSGYERLMRSLKLRSSNIDQSDRVPHKADHRESHKSDHRADHRSLQS
jgi:hypothetical protein